MKQIVFTKHAEEMLLVRRINKIMVVSCLTQPTRVVQAKKDTSAYLKEFDAQCLKVIAAEEKDALVVITVYWIAKSRAKQ